MSSHISYEVARAWMEDLHREADRARMAAGDRSQERPRRRLFRRSRG